MVHVFKNIRERSIAKNYHPVSLHLIVSRVFETFDNNRLDDYLRMWLFLDFQYGLGICNQLQILSQLQLI